MRERQFSLLNLPCAILAESFRSVLLLLAKKETKKACCSGFSRCCCFCFVPLRGAVGGLFGGGLRQKTRAEKCPSAA